MALTGRCLCGAIRFTADDVEVHHHACHCEDCRRWVGGPFLAAACGSVAFEGADMLVRYASSTWAERGFCRACGTTLFYYLRPAERFMMSVGSFDDPAPFELVREIFIDRKPPGYAFAGDHPRWTAAETFARLAPSD